MLSIIIAMGKNREIGKNNKMPWHLPDDLKRFKKLTMNKTMIMGRKTFESLPGILPGRKHIIVTRNKSYTVASPQVSICHDLNEIIKSYKDSLEESFIIGGGALIKDSLQYCSKLYVTYIDSSFDADTFFPEIDLSSYNSHSSEYFTDKASGLKYKYITLLAKFEIEN